MPHGQPDYGIYKPKVTTFGLDDMGELAARLFSPVTFDRRGDVLILDNFEGGEGGWKLSSLPVTTGQELSAITARSGGFSMQLRTGAGIGNWARMLNYFPYPVLSRMGAEISFVFNGNMSEYEFVFVLYDGTNFYQALLRFTRPADIWEIDNNGAWVTVKSGSMLTETYLFNTLKLVVDFTTAKYVRLIINESEVDLSAYSLLTGAPGLTPQLRFGVKVTVAVAANHVAYFDDFILTQNEP